MLPMAATDYRGQSVPVLPIVSRSLPLSIRALAHTGARLPRSAEPVSAAYPSWLLHSRSSKAGAHPSGVRERVSFETTVGLSGLDNPSTAALAHSGYLAT